MQKLRDAFRRVSWWGFISFLCAAIGLIAFVFFAESFKLAVVMLLFAIWSLLAAIYDSP